MIFSLITHCIEGDNVTTLDRVLDLSEHDVINADILPPMRQRLAALELVNKWNDQALSQYRPGGKLWHYVLGLRIDGG